LKKKGEREKKGRGREQREISCTTIAVYVIQKRGGGGKEEREKRRKDTASVVHIFSLLQLPRGEKKGESLGPTQK